MNGFARGRRRPLPDVEERLASLDEELQLTTAFAAAMTRRGHLHSAVSVVDEQRVRLAEAKRFLLRKLGTRRRRRIRAGLSSVLAALVLGSGSYAALRAVPEPTSDAQLVRQASARLEEAAATRDAGQFAEIVGRVNARMLELTAEELSDPTLRLEVAGLVGVAEQILENFPGSSAALLAQVKKVAATVGVTAPKDPPQAPKPKPTTPQTPTKPEPTPAPDEPTGTGPETPQAP